MVKYCPLCGWIVVADDTELCPTCGEQLESEEDKNDG